jgi:hypothetical protein
MKRDDLACRGIHGNPDPLLVGVLSQIWGVSHLLHMALLKKVSRLIRLMVVGASRDIMPKAAF